MHTVETHGVYGLPMDVTSFDNLEPVAAAAVVRVWADIAWWVDGLVAARPYGTVDALEAAARTGARQWTPDDLGSALAHHPRIGERPAGAGAQAQASRAEQSSMTTAGDDLTARIAAGNAQYEATFGRVFLIRAAGRSPQQMLDELQRRLSNDAATETGEALTQLAEIALLRLRTAVTERTPG